MFLLIICLFFLLFFSQYTLYIEKQMKLNNALWIFCILFAGLILCAFIHTNFEHLYLGNSLEGMTSDSNGNNMSGQIEINGKTYYINSSDSSGNVNYDNYNHYDQTSTSSALISGTTFYNDKGGSATVITTANGTQIIKDIL